MEPRRNHKWWLVLDLHHLAHSGCVFSVFQSGMIGIRSVLITDRQVMLFHQGTNRICSGFIQSSQAKADARRGIVAKIGLVHFANLG